MYPEIQPTRDRYHVVPYWRFALFSLATFGVYPIYWFWKNWSLIKAADNSDITPWLRALFSPISCLWLITDINTQLAHAGKSSRLSVFFAVGYILGSLFYRAPGLYSLLGVVFSSVCLWPLIDEMKGLSSAAAIAEGSAWRLRHTNLMLVSAAFALFVAYAATLPAE